MQFSLCLRFKTCLRKEKEAKYSAPNGLFNLKWFQLVIFIISQALS